MGKRTGIEGSLALAEAVKLADVDVIAAYPITPQTHIVEGLSEMVAEGELDAEFVCVESEHSAMSACLGSSAAGARTFTATAGQGLELMHECVYIASSMRLPIVMGVANRALSAPLSVWGDHSDAMACRDTGWIQVFCEDGQEVHDLALWAFRVAEDKNVLFPVMIHLDGFHLTHVVEPVELRDAADVKKFLPPNDYPMSLNPERPLTLGAFGPPNVYTEAKKAQEEAFLKIKPHLIKGWDEFEKVFGQRYKPVETYNMEGAETAMITMGSYSETAMLAVDELRAKGKKVGLTRIRLWRPFPFEELRAALKGVKKIIVLDRAISSGGPGGPVLSEVRNAMYDVDDRPKIVGFIAGLGGRDVLPQQFVEMFGRGEELADKGQEGPPEILFARE